jgi:hypothetical protein
MDMSPNSAISDQLSGSKPRMHSFETLWWISCSKFKHCAMMPDSSCRQLVVVPPTESRLTPMSALGQTRPSWPRRRHVHSCPQYPQYRPQLQCVGARSVVPCVDGSELARLFFTFAGWSVQPCVRPVRAVHMTAGHNALRGSGPGQKPAFDNALAQVGCPDRRIGRLCITCCWPSQPSHHAGYPARSVTPRRIHRSKRNGWVAMIYSINHRRSPVASVGELRLQGTSSPICG